MVIFVIFKISGLRGPCAFADRGGSPCIPDFPYPGSFCFSARLPDVPDVYREGGGESIFCENSGEHPEFRVLSECHIAEITKAFQAIAELFKFHLVDNLPVMVDLEVEVLSLAEVFRSIGSRIGIIRIIRVAICCFMTD